MNTKDIVIDVNVKDNDLRILVIDKLLSEGWTSYLDMNLAMSKFKDLVAKKNNFPKIKDYKNVEDYYSALLGPYGFTSNIMTSDMPHLIDVWALVNKGEDIEGALLRERRSGNKGTDSLKREEMRKCFIETHDFDIDKEGELEKYPISKETMVYLQKHRKAGEQTIRIFRYVKKDYSIREDLNSYNNELRKPIKELRESGGKMVIDTNIGFIPDPDVMARKVRELTIKALQEALLRDTTGAVQRRLERIADLKQSKPVGWMHNTSNIYRNAIYDGKGIMQENDIGPIIHKYGAYLLDTKVYAQGGSSLKEALDSVRSYMCSGDLESQKEYAMILQNLASLHVILCNIQLAEEETLEALEIFRNLAQQDEKYKYGIAVMLNSLAAIHLQMLKLDVVEEEYKEAEVIYKQLSDAEPTGYIYMYMENISSLANFYNYVGRKEESLEAYDRAMPFLEYLTEKNFDDFAPIQVTAMINHASALQDSGEYIKAKEQLEKTIDIINRLDVPFPGVFKDDLSTAYHNIAVLYAYLGDLENACRRLTEAERLRRELVKNDADAFNYHLAATLDTQAQILSKTDYLNEAIEKWNEALSLVETYEGDEHDGLLSQKANYCSYLGSTLMRLSENEEALPYLQRAETIYQTIFDRESRPKMFEDSYALTLMNLAMIYDTNDSTQDLVESKFEEALDVANWYATRVKEVDISFLVSMYFEYGHFLYNKGRLADALQMLRLTVEKGKSEIAKPYNHTDIKAIMEVAQEGIRSIETFMENPENYNDEEFPLWTEIANYTGNINYDIVDEQDDETDEDSHYTGSDALQQLQRIADMIGSFDRNAVGYREHCEALYAEAVGYYSYLDDSLFLADFLSSHCHFLVEGYDFKPVEKYGKRAVGIYEKALREDNSNLQLRLKYLTVLSYYCSSLDEHTEKDLLYGTIQSAMELLTPINMTSPNDLACTCVALEGELMVDFIDSNNPQNVSETCGTILKWYRDVTDPDRAMMCRFLTKAAYAAGDNEEWEKVESYITEAEELMQGCDENDLENLLCLGKLYTLKFHYLGTSPLQFSDNDNDDYSLQNRMKVFNKAEQWILRGVDRNPALFKAQLVELYRTILMSYKWPFYKKEMKDVSERILQLVGELCQINEYAFTWRSVVAYLEVVETIMEVSFVECWGNQITLGELENDYQKAMLMYADMESMMSVYNRTDGGLAAAFNSKIAEAKNKLKSEMREAKK